MTDSDFNTAEAVVAVVDYFRLYRALHLFLSAKPFDLLLGMFTNIAFAFEEDKYSKFWLKTCDNLVQRPLLWHNQNIIKSDYQVDMLRILIK